VADHPIGEWRIVIGLLIPDHPFHGCWYAHYLLLFPLPHHTQGLRHSSVISAGSDRNHARHVPPWLPFHLSPTAIFMDTPIRVNRQPSPFMLFTPDSTTNKSLPQGCNQIYGRA
jgi:hypothetical protein